MSIVFTGPAGVETFRAIALKQGLKMYAQHKMKPNRVWTPTAMLQAAGRITGKTYKRGHWWQAIIDLEEWININGTNGSQS